MIMETNAPPRGRGNARLPAGVRMTGGTAPAGRHAGAFAGMGESSPDCCENRMQERMSDMKQLHGTDQRTMAYINLYGVLGALEELCRLDEQARQLIADRAVRIGFRVSGGPCATLCFDHGTCVLADGDKDCDIRLPFSSPAKFNGMIDGTVTPIPSRGLTKLKFLTGPFLKLTDRLTRYLRASEQELQDPELFQKSTTLMFYAIAASLSQIGTHDRIGRASAGYIPDGVICLRIKDGPAASICAKDHILHTVKKAPEHPAAVMEFGSMKIARELFDGRRNAMASIGVGEIRVSGMMPMLDNMNRILDRVGLYLA